MAKNKKTSIYWVCYDCGIKQSGRSFSVSCYHIGKCDICKKKKAVTEYRDFFYGHRKEEEY
jgi:hypothetical protein